MREFISEDDLDTFEGYLRYQGSDFATAASDERAKWLEIFERSKERSAATPRVGTMTLRRGVDRYAVAVRDGLDLWLALWVQRSQKKEFFVMMPRGDRDWDCHTSYHCNGNLHHKSYGRKSFKQKLQPLDGVFRGTEALGAYSGFGPKRIGAICDPSAFKGVVELAPGVLGPRDGTVVIDLIEPGCEPTSWPSARIVRHEVFSDFCPSVVIRVGS